MPELTSGGRHTDLAHLSGKAEKVLELLAQGFSTKLVASTVGIAESEVSRFKKDEDFMAIVADRRTENLDKIIGRDKRYDALEDRILDRLELVIPMLMKPHDIFRASEVINRAARRSEKFVETKPAEVGTTNIVVLQLPAASLTAFAMNARNEMVSVNGRSLTALPTTELMKQIVPQTFDMTATLQKSLEDKPFISAKEDKTNAVYHAAPEVGDVQERAGREGAKARGLEKMWAKTVTADDI